MSQQELYLYRIQVEGEEKTFHLVVVASSDEKAFDTAEKELERYMLVSPKVKEWLLLEKKRIRSGAGYVIDPTV
ncbi:DUF3906 family protein [Thermoflavimicrobium daqui]|uniref:DUF3906 domain-containing protein n=1 Tax=Thermoflavimicrobium daqui TaxID=2137476 RepID=A0A364K4Z0_9BACL|nr:DUF3906 family protein [Thermoflavimicrobium daqui]RAL24435.1 DUF3906 domain-containing protein [Thermoflavimicrobium daqui]